MAVTMPPYTTNRYKEPPCLAAIVAFKWVPVIFLMSIISWSYYAYVVEMCFVSIESLSSRIWFLTFFHIFFGMLVWSYWKASFTKIAHVPIEYRLKPDIVSLMTTEPKENHGQILENAAKDLPINNFNSNGMIRYCNKCKLIKPDRTHHCSVCRRCIPKMDHHCPWINNCVAFNNYKFFLLFLAYALIYCLYVGLTCLPFAIAFWKNNMEGMRRYHLLFLFFLAAIFEVSLLPLFGYHCFLVLENRTTLEAFKAPIFRNGPNKNGYKLPMCQNLREVFGNGPKYWFLPINSSLGNGFEFPMNEGVQQQQQQHQVYNSVKVSTA